MKQLTDTQQRTLDFIRGYIRQNGLSPTIAEIAEGMGWSSPNSVATHLDALQRKGCLIIRRGSWRGIRLSSASYEYDSQALVAANRIMEIIGLAGIEKEKWPEMRIKAAIQVEVINAMQWAALTGG